MSIFFYSEKGGGVGWHDGNPVSIMWRSGILPCKPHTIYPQAPHPPSLRNVCPPYKHLSELSKIYQSGAKRRVGAIGITLLGEQSSGERRFNCNLAFVLDRVSCLVDWVSIAGVGRPCLGKQRL